MGTELPGARGLTCLLALLALACEADVALVVQVRTDLTPLREFELARVTVTNDDGLDRDALAAAADHRAWGVGVRVAELYGLSPGRHRVSVRLETADGAVLVERPARVDLEPGANVVTVLLTRDCAGVVCPAVGDAAEATACLAGRCVREECFEEGPDACEPECATAADCDPVGEAACAEVECSPSGSCFVAPRADACAEGAVCDPRVGACVPADGCADWGPFGAPVALGPAINSSANEYGPSLSADGLTLYFARTDDVTSWIMRARRDVPAGPFGEPERVPGLEGSNLGEPSISADGQRLYVALDPEDSRSSLHVARRRADGSFEPPTPLDFVPREPGLGATGADVTADELELVYVSQPYLLHEIVRVTRERDDEPFTGPTLEAATMAAGGATGWPSISGDGLELFFEADPGTGELDLFRSTRADRGRTFGAPQALDALNDPALDGDADLSYDGSTLWFASRRSGVSGTDLYVAARECR